jgi:membrane protein YqaA with SNARE-associated domain
VPLPGASFVFSVRLAPLANSDVPALYKIPSPLHQIYAAHLPQMPTRPLATLSSVSPHSVMAWVLHLGGIGLIPLGLLDNSIVPIPGSMDVATILLAARDKQLWFYYAAMATLGSVIGGYLTYRIARKGGKEALGKRFSKRKVQKVLKTFERWGFLAIVVPAMLPPPLPTVPFLIAAGAMQYSRTKFLTALTIGRLIRYTIFAFLGATYGRHIISLFTRHGYAVLFVALGVSVAAVIFILLVRRYRK